jgi:hypothetical protein
VTHASGGTGQTRRIELKLREMAQLFNSMDPSPFNEKDLDHDAEEFIVSWAQEYPSKAPLELVVYLDQWPDEDPGQVIQQAVHHYFSYRGEIHEMEFRHLLKQARTSLLIGLAFLATCLFTSHVLLGKVGEQGWVFFLRESLTILGWVAMWRPIQIYLYDWWPVRQQIAVYEKLGKMPVRVVKKNG